MQSTFNIYILKLFKWTPKKNGKKTYQKKQRTSHCLWLWMWHVGNCLRPPILPMNVKKWRRNGEEMWKKHAIKWLNSFSLAQRQLSGVFLGLNESQKTIRHSQSNEQKSATAVAAPTITEWHVLFVKTHERWTVSWSLSPLTSELITTLCWCRDRTSHISLLHCVCVCLPPTWYAYNVYMNVLNALTGNFTKNICWDWRWIVHFICYRCWFCVHVVCWMVHCAYAYIFNGLFSLVFIWLVV